MKLYKKKNMLKTIFSELKDNRRGQGQRYDLEGFLVSCVLGILSGATSYRKLHTFMEGKLEVLKEHIGVKWRKAPSYVTIRNILKGIDSRNLEECFRKYSLEINKLDKTKNVFLALDGKSVRGSFDYFEDREAIQLLSAFITGKDIIIAHEVIEGKKENEIPVIQRLVKDIDISGMILTLDALHCQKKH